MSESQSKQPNIHLSEMLPVGMLAHGGSVGLAMAAVANRKYGQAGWEAFHYERISESEFEITGGMVVLAGGAKKWPGPHESVIISEFEILQEMQMTHPSEPPAKTEASEATGPIGAASVASVSAAGGYLNVQFALPEDEAGRQRILQAFHLQANFFGARVLSCSLQDKAN